MTHKKIIGVIQFFIAILLLHSYQLLAQDSTIQLTLKDAIDLSIKNSKQLKGSEARIVEAVAATQEAKDKRLPDFKISGSYLRLNNPNVNLQSKSGGGSSSADSNKVKVSSALYGIANISYPLYSGGRIKYGIESANYLEQAAKLDADNNRSAVILNAVNAYVNLFKAKEAVKLVKENLEQSRKRDTDFGNLEKNGLLARNDLLKVQLQTSNLELSLADAESDWKLANVNMDLMLGLPEKTMIIQDTSNIKVPDPLQTIEEYEKQAIEGRNDIKALAMRQKSAGVGIKISKSEYYLCNHFSGVFVWRAFGNSPASIIHACPDVKNQRERFHC